MRRLGWFTGAVAVAALVGPDAASAHGLVGRADLPIPEWLFVWGAATVLVISFVALAVLWRTPQLEGGSERRLVRIPRAIEIAAGAIGFLLFAALVYVGLAGSQVVTKNPIPTFVYVLFWVGLVPISAVFGDVFRAFNPWRAVARAAGWLARRVADRSPPAPLEYPAWLGAWPAVAGLVGFGWLELVAVDGNDPSKLASAALVYAAIQLVGMSLYGVDRWSERGDAFGLYFGMFARLSPFGARDGHLVLRRPLSALSEMRRLPGMVVFVCAAIAITAFDGASEGTTWQSIVPGLQEFFTGLGFSVGEALQLAFTFGLVAFVALVAAFYRVGVSGMRSAARSSSASELAPTFAHSLVPIALAYVVAHYVSFAIFQGQATAYLISDPLGDGSDLFGTAGRGIDYGVISATTVWYVQVASLVVGHALALAVAHDRAIVAFKDSRTAVRSQYWMLVVMIGFTSLGLWLLSAANH